MRSKLIAESPKTYALILEKRDEILSSLKNFAHAESGTSLELAPFERSRRIDTERQKMSLAAVYA
jgi:hypothetical protein